MNETKFIVNEIFESIDGEGLRTGSLAIFIRLAGCNLRCSYCDTSYALEMAQGEPLTASEILGRISIYRTRHITLTGGEPLLQPCISELIDSLTENGYIVNIETNGSVDITPYQTDGTIITMDYKTPSSGVEKKMRLENISLLRGRDVLKFVCGKGDIPTVNRILHQYRPTCWVYLSPVFGEIEPSKLVDFLRAYPGESEKIRVQVQLHKIIWNPEERGV